PLGVSGALDVVARGVTECSLDIIRPKSAGIEQSPRDAVRGVGIADDGGACALEADKTTATTVGNRNDVSSGVVITRGSGKDARHLPVPNNLVYKARSIC